jgi:predicted transcriptional regulator
MERLSTKKLLTQLKRSNAFLYIPSLSKESFTRSTIKEVLDGLLEDFYEPVTTQFVDSMDEVKEEKIGKLAALIEEKRRR